MGVQLSKQAIDLGIVTANGQAMLAFYRDVVGLKYVREMAMPGGNGTMHQLMCGDSMIKLVVKDSVPARAATGDIAAASGYRYWTITVSNLSEILASCAAASHKVVVPERELRPGVRIGIVADPDGNLLEFLTLS